MGRGVTIRQLTVKERILLHLFDYNRFADAYEAPFEVAQAGISEAVGIRVQNVGYYVIPLVSKGLLKEKKAYVKGKPRRRKVYFLTFLGRQRVESHRKDLLQEIVPVRTEEGAIDEMLLSRVIREFRPGSGLLELIDELSSAGYITAIAETRSSALVDYSQEALEVERFYGRERELAAAMLSLAEAPVLVVTGLAGIGKTALGSKICEELRGTRSIFWRRVRPWDTAIDLALRLASFLRALGKARLYSYLKGSSPKVLSRIEELLAVDFTGLGALIVLDDVHTASKEANSFFSILRESLKGQTETNVLMLSRSVPDFYSRREVKLEGSVEEIFLRGLDPASCEALLAELGVEESQVANLVAQSRGSPLFLRILARMGIKTVSAKAWTELETYISEQIEPSLSKEERDCLQIACLYELPVRAEGLLLEERGGTGTLISLKRKSLLEQLDSGEWVAHDLIRSYFQDGLPLERRRDLVNKVVPWLREEASRFSNRGKPQDAVALLENALLIERRRDRQVLVLESLAEQRNIVGDYLRSEETYRKAIRQTNDVKLKARIYQKLTVPLGNHGRLKDAMQVIEEGLGLMPPGPSLEVAWLLYRRATTARDLRDFESYGADLDELGRWISRVPEDLGLNGRIASNRGDFNLIAPGHFNPTRAEAYLREALGMSETVGDKALEDSVCLYLSRALMELGRTDEGLAFVDRAVAVTDELGSPPGKAFTSIVKASYLAEFIGDLEAATSLYQEIEPLARRLEDLESLTLLHFGYAQLHHRQNRHREARKSMERFLELSRGREEFTKELRLTNLAFMARLCIDCDDPDAAKRYLDEAKQLHNGGQSGAEGHELEWAEAMIRAYRGDQRGAMVSFRRAMDHVPPPTTERCNGMFLLDYGRFMASAGTTKEASVILTEAYEDLARRHRRPFEQRAKEALQSLLI